MPRLVFYFVLPFTLLFLYQIVIERLQLINLPISISNKHQNQNATFLTLCRNEDIFDILETIQNIEDRFNSKYHYDWVFLNDKAFTSDFKSRVKRMVSGGVKFGQIDANHWSVPDFIDNDRYEQSLEKLKDKVIYGDSKSYRNMCRWYSGFFQWHELLLDYKYYWRVEPGVKFYCDIDYDPFEFMFKNGIRYSFIISILEYKVTITNLFQQVVEFFQDSKNSELIQDLIPNQEDSLYDFIIDSNGQYNLCHFWTNFEIGDLDLFRSDLYTTYFNHIDSKGGFFYERYGDGPVRSIFLSLFLKKNEVHWINDFGYKHSPYLQCPSGLANKCSCDETQDFTYHDYSCTGRFLEVKNRK